MDGTKPPKRMEEEEFTRMCRGPTFSLFAITKAAVTPANTVSRLERERYNVRRGTDTQRTRRRERLSSDAAERIARAEQAPRLASAGRTAGWSVGRSGSLTRTVADPSVDYSGDLT